MRRNWPFKSPETRLLVETTKASNPFGAVHMMRDLRTKISQGTKNMSFQELQQYIKQRLKFSNLRPTPGAR